MGSHDIFQQRAFGEVFLLLSLSTLVSHYHTGDRSIVQTTVVIAEMATK